MKITVLAENTSCCGLPSEHGLSLFLDCAVEQSHGYRILFDTGRGELFASNAKALGVDIGKADISVISHGHYDHGGGIKVFIEENRHAPIYISNKAFEKYYNETGSYIGLDRHLKENSDRIVFVDKRTEIADGITIYTADEIEKKVDFGSFGLTVNNTFQPDEFGHEIYLLINENGKRILISGCSHNGIINIVDRFKPDVMVGGFHFFKMEPDEKMKHYAQVLDSYDTEYYTCHCTGTGQYEFLKQYMKRLHYISTGQTVNI